MLENARLISARPASLAQLTARRARLTVLLSFLLIAALGCAACRGDSNTAGNINSQNAGAPPATPSPRTPQTSAFDGSRAFEHVRKQVEFGPRPAGSSELARTREFITTELKSYGLTVTTDEFNATTPVGQRQMANVVGELAGESNEVIIIASHYDTKLYREFRFVGANDAGSSTGALLEIARVMTETKQKPRFTYWFVFFDGEEAFCEDWNQCQNPDGPDNTYGSRHLVAQLKTRNELRRVRAMILLDMVGFKELNLGRNDHMSTRWLIDTIWQTASEMGHGNVFVTEPEDCDGDDHVPFLREGIDAIDVIQLATYPHWHTPEDTLDKISPRSLKIVGDVVLASLPRIEERLLSTRPR